MFLLLSWLLLIILSINSEYKRFIIKDTPNIINCLIEDKAQFTQLVNTGKYSSKSVLNYSFLCEHKNDLIKVNYRVYKEKSIGDNIILKLPSTYSYSFWSILAIIFISIHISICLLILVYLFYFLLKKAI